MSAGIVPMPIDPESVRTQDRIRLLLVDDNEDNLVSLEATLQGLADELVCAQSGAEVLRHVLENDDFAAILLDVKMPGMDGFEIAEHGLGGEGDDRQRTETRQGADGPHRFVAVHIRHHDIHEHGVEVRLALEQFDSRAAVLDVAHGEIPFLQDAGEGEDVADIVVDHQQLAAGEHEVVGANGAERLLLRKGKVIFGAVEQQNRLVEQPVSG